MMVEPRTARALERIGRPIARQSDEEHPSAGATIRLRTEAAGDLVAVQARKADVDEGHIGRLGSQELQAGAAFFGVNHLMPIELQHHPKHLASIAIVFDDEHASVAGLHARPLFSASTSANRSHRRQANRKQTPAIRTLAIDSDGTIVQLYEPPNQGEANPESTLRPVERPLTLHE
ncbi:MAG TPA: hypothetical protein VGI23_25655 [Steroidobacteraceae bacterium]